MIVTFKLGRIAKFGGGCQVPIGYLFHRTFDKTNTVRKHCYARLKEIV